MITYIIRRLLYSILVLIAASFLVFTFVAKGAGDPLGPIRVAPNVDQAGPRSHRRGEAPQRLRLRALRLLGAGRGHGQLRRRRCSTNKPILPELWRVMKNTLQLVIVAELIAILIAIGIGVLSALRQYSRLRLHGDDVQLSRLSDAALLARADARRCSIVQIQSWTGVKFFPIASLSDVDPGSGLSFVDRPRPPPRSAGDGAHDCEHRARTRASCAPPCSRS